MNNYSKVIINRNIYKTICILVFMKYNLASLTDLTFATTDYFKNSTTETLIISEHYSNEIISGNLNSFHITDIAKSSNKSNLPILKENSSMDQIYEKMSKFLEEKLTSDAYAGNLDSVLSFENFFYGMSKDALNDAKKEQFIQLLLKNQFLNKNTTTPTEFTAQLQKISLPIEVHNSIMFQLFEMVDNIFNPYFFDTKKSVSKNRYLEHKLIQTKGERKITTFAYKTEDKVIIKALHYQETPGLAIDCYNPFITKEARFHIGHLPIYAKREYNVCFINSEGVEDIIKTENLFETVKKIKSQKNKIKFTEVMKTPIFKNVY